MEIFWGMQYMAFGNYSVDSVKIWKCISHQWSLIGWSNKKCRGSKPLYLGGWLENEEKKTPVESVLMANNKLDYCIAHAVKVDGFDI